MIIGYKKNRIFSLQKMLFPESDINVWVVGASEDVEKVDWFNNGVFITSGENAAMPPSQGFNRVMARVLYKNGTFRERNMAVHGEIPGRHISDFGVLENSSIYEQEFGAKITYREGNIEYTSDITPNVQSAFNFENFKFFSEDKYGNQVYQSDITIKGKLKSKSNGLEINVNLKASWAFPLH